MTTPPTQTLAVKCPGCGARFQIAGEMAGRKGRCAKCNIVFRVPGSATTAAIVEPIVKKQETQPQYISVLCRVCQTLMYGRLDQVGQPLKCPDCGAQTVVPPPQPVKAKKPLAAMEGEQYELWGVDEAPSVAEMLAAQPKYIAVECRLCRTLMHATEDQVGKRLKCPDCGTANLVSPPERPTPIVSVLARDEDDLLIDVSRDPGDRPPVIVPPRKPMLYEEEAEAERKRQEEKRARGDTRGPQYDVRGHAVMPAWPLATRILPFLFSRGVPVRWIVLSLGAFCGGGLMLYAIVIAMSGGFGAIGGMALFALAVILLLIWFAALSATIYTIVTESSEGSDEVHHWPGTGMSEWLGELWYMLVACLVSPFPGWALGQVLDPTARTPGFLLSLVICLPVVILSQLDGDSAFSVASPRVIASLLRLPGTWLMFYLEIAALAAINVAMTIAASQFPIVGLILVPLFVATLLLAARILGRLAWKLAETLPVRE